MWIKEYGTNNSCKPRTTFGVVSEVVCRALPTMGEAANTIAATLRSKYVSVTCFTFMTTGIKCSEWRV